MIGMPCLDSIMNPLPVLAIDRPAAVFRSTSNSCRTGTDRPSDSVQGIVTGHPEWDRTDARQVTIGLRSRRVGTGDRGPPPSVQICCLSGFWHLHLERAKGLAMHMLGTDRACILQLVAKLHICRLV